MPIKTQTDQPVTLNLTPMIDILFLLIIFFMVGTQFTEMENSLDVQVPSVTSSEAHIARPAIYTISVARTGTVYLDGVEVGIAELTDQLVAARTSQGSVSVTIRGDAQGAFQHVASVLNTCRQAGVRDLSVAVRPSQRSTY